MCAAIDEVIRFDQRCFRVLLFSFKKIQTRFPFPSSFFIFKMLKLFFSGACSGNVTSGLLLGLVACWASVFASMSLSPRRCLLFVGFFVGVSSCVDGVASQSLLGMHISASASACVAMAFVPHGRYPLSRLGL